MTSTKRFRSRGALLPVPYKLDGVNYDGSTFSMTGTMGEAGSYEQMIDVVTRPFKPGVDLVNMPLEAYKVNKVYEPPSGSITSDMPAGSTGVRTFSGTYTYWGPQDAVFDKLLNGSALASSDHLISLACTKALAGVQQAEVSGLVALAEFRETVQSLLHPIDATLKWLARNAPSKKKRRKRSYKAKASELAKAVSDQHLTVVFGILPFISDIQGILKALESLEPLPVRQTARGKASQQIQESETEVQRVHDSLTEYSDQSTTASVTRTVTVRAYQLYETKVTIANALGITFSNVPLAVWQTATLSFVVDWFANVGDFISALTPRADISYLASGYTITAVDVCTATGDHKIVRKPSPPTTYGWAGAFVGGVSQRVEVTKLRVPDSLFPHVGIHLKQRMGSSVLTDVFKVTAGLSLITQRLSAYLPKR